MYQLLRRFTGPLPNKASGFRRRSFWLWAVIFALVQVILALVPATTWAQKGKPAPPPPFRYEVLYILPDAISSRASGMNDRGDVVGSSDTGPFVFLFNAGQSINPNAVVDPELGLYVETAVDINNSGQVTGICSREGFRSPYRLTPMPTGYWDLEVIAARDYIDAVGSINEDGDILFVEWIEAQDAYKVFVWEAGTTPPVQTNLRNGGLGNGLSNRDANGAIVFVAGGRKYIYQTGSDPLLIASPTIAPLGSLGLGQTNATTVNSVGHVAGDGLVSQKSRTSKWQAFLQTGGPSTIKNLGVVGANDSIASSLNNIGDVIGTSDSSENWALGIRLQVGFIYTGGKMYDLRTMVDNDADGYKPVQHRDRVQHINDSKLIAGTTLLQTGEPERAYLLLPYTP